MSQKPTVLVTGATGYIAGWVVKYFLNAGFKVRGTSRSKSSAQPLIDTLVSEGYSASDIEIYEIPDITVAGVFDEAVNDVEAIAHLASPVSMSFTDPGPVIRTAVEGSISILRSAKAHGNKLKTFVNMSSIVSIWDPTIEGEKVFTENDWNEFAYPATQKLGTASPGPVIYMASKVEAEKAVWKFRDEEKPTFNVISINPAWVSGPPVVKPKDKSKIGETTRTIFDVLSGSKDVYPLAAATYVHVYDVARLFVWAVENGEKANGERYLAVAGRSGVQPIRDILRKAYPERADIIEAGEPGEGYLPDWSFSPGGPSFDVSKAVKATGQDWIQLDQTVLDTAKAYEFLL